MRQPDARGERVGARTASALARDAGPAVERLASSGEFRALRDAWQVLHRECGGAATPFNSWEWLFSWWQTYGAARPLWLLVVRDAAGLAGIAPLYQSREPAGCGVHCDVLRLVGDGSHDSDYLAFLARPGAEASVLAALEEWLARQRGWDALALRELPPGSPLPDALVAMARQRRMLVRAENGRCGVLDLPASFDDFLRTRQSRFRTKLRSLLRKIDDGSIVFESTCSAPELRGRLRSLFALHQERWRRAGQAGVFGAAAKRLFYARFVTRFARRGWLRLYSLRSGERYVAHELCFGYDGTTYLLQEGFDTSDPSASHGQALRAAVIRHLIAQGEARYDFLGGISRHKSDWGARESAVQHLLLIRRTWRGRLLHAAPAARAWMTDFAKRVLPPALQDRVRRRRAMAANLPASDGGTAS